MLAAKLAGGIVRESVLFSFNEKGCGQVMCQAAYAWVEDLETKIVETLNYNEKFVSVTMCIKIVQFHPCVFI